MPMGYVTKYPLTELDACAKLSMRACDETMRAMAERLHIPQSRLIDMIQGKEPLSRRVMRDLGLRREIRYREINNESL
jgi:hypothetical protein